MATPNPELSVDDPEQDAAFQLLLGRQASDSYYLPEELIPTFRSSLPTGKQRVYVEKNPISVLYGTIVSKVCDLLIHLHMERNNNRQVNWVLVETLHPFSHKFFEGHIPRYVIAVPTIEYSNLHDWVERTFHDDRFDETYRRLIADIKSISSDLFAEHDTNIVLSHTITIAALAFRFEHEIAHIYRHLDVYSNLTSNTLLGKTQAIKLMELDADYNAATSLVIKCMNAGPLCFVDNKTYLSGARAINQIVTFAATLTMIADLPDTEIVTTFEDYDKTHLPWLVRLNIVSAILQWQYTALDCRSLRMIGYDIFDPAHYHVILAITVKVGGNRTEILHLSSEEADSLDAFCLAAREFYYGNIRVLNDANAEEERTLPIQENVFRADIFKSTINFKSYRADARLPETVTKLLHEKFSSAQRAYVMFVRSSVYSLEDFGVSGPSASMGKVDRQCEITFSSQELYELLLECWTLFVIRVREFFETLESSWGRSDGSDVWLSTAAGLSKDPSYRAIIDCHEGNNYGVQKLSDYVMFEQLSGELVTCFAGTYDPRDGLHLRQTPFLYLKGLGPTTAAARALKVPRHSPLTYFEGFIRKESDFFLGADFTFDEFGHVREIRTNGPNKKIIHYDHLELVMEGALRTLQKIAVEAGQGKS